MNNRRLITRENAIWLIKRTYLEYAFALRYLNDLSQGVDSIEARRVQELFREFCNFFNITENRFSILYIDFVEMYSR